jgi:hypothetical protein
MAEALTIARRFRGPPESGNGGYSCGVLARRLGDAQVEVSLRLPPPLDRPLEVERGDGEAGMRDGDRLVAEAREIEGFELEVPEPVSLEEAVAARESSRLHRRHPFPGCFVCGPERDAGDGLLVVCGDTGRGSVAAPWDPDDSLPASGGAVAEEIVWAVLDCPGGLSGMLVPEMTTSVLARMAARIHREVSPRETHVALGWPIEHEGRKFTAGSALFTAEGELVAEALALWIAPRA